jgi:hypothetical protein
MDWSEQSKARSLYDLTFSAPKSISVQALVAGDERLITAHDRAVRAALTEAESHAATRVRLHGENEDRTTGNWVVATYRHDASRELDPQLHTHAVAANLTYDGVEGRWKALQASGLYERRAYLTEVYRNTLAHEVRSLGYEIETRRDSRGRDLGFEIRGVSARRWMHPAACLLVRACQRLWLFGSYGAFGGSHLLDISFSLTLPPLRLLQCERTPYGVLPIQRKEDGCLDSSSTQPLPATPMSIGYCGRTRRFSSLLSC